MTRRTKATVAAAPEGVTPGVPYRFWSGEEWQAETASVPAEMPLTIFINGLETVTVLCTPTRLTQLVLGFLYTEGIIDSTGDVASLRVCVDEPIADVKLAKTDFKLPPRRTLTSGCGSAVSAKVAGKRVESDVTVTPPEILSLMKQLFRRQELFQTGGGVHCSALCDRQKILSLAEDIGRHNTLDKIMGECLMSKLSTQDGILLTTGRLSSEMLLKAARMQTPIIASRGSPTGRAIALGRELNITVIGYARENRLSVFSAEHRLLPGKGK
jgi:FdhD protein